MAKNTEHRFEIIFTSILISRNLKTINKTPSYLFRNREEWFVLHLAVK